MMMGPKAHGEGHRRDTQMDTKFISAKLSHVVAAGPKMCSLLEVAGRLLVGWLTSILDLMILILFVLTS